MVVQEDYLNAQCSVLGSLLIAPELTGRVMAKLRSEDFSDPNCRLIWQAITGLFVEGRPIDPVLVRDRVSAIEDIGSVLREIMIQTPTAQNIWAYVDIVREQSRLTKMRSLGAQLFDAATVDSAADIISTAYGMLSERPGVHRLGAKDLLADFYERHGDGKSPEYYSWSVPALDAQLYTEAGDFVILGGYPSAGKTALALRFAWHQAQTHRVGFYSLETRTSKLADRSVAAIAGIDMGTIKHSALKDAEWKSVADQSGSIVSRQIDFIQAGGMTVSDIQADALSHRYEIIYIDYIQLINAPKIINRTEAVTAISIALHQFAQAQNVMVVGLSQLRRPETSPKKDQAAPGMSSLRESGQLEQDADAIMLLYKERPDDLNSRRILKVAKNKEGTIGLIFLDFDGPCQRFSPSDTSKDVAAHLSAIGRAAKRRQISMDQSQLHEFDGQDDPDFPF